MYKMNIIESIYLKLYLLDIFLDIFYDDDHRYIMRADDQGQTRPSMIITEIIFSHSVSCLFTMT